MLCQVTEEANVASDIDSYECDHDEVKFYRAQ